MDDLKARLEKLLTDAIECDLIADLATNKNKQDAFRSLAHQHRAMAEAIRQTLAMRDE